MAPRIRVSRSGLTRCPSCHTHIKLSEALAEARCPTCGAGFDAHAAPGKATSLRGLAHAGRSGALLVALLGAAACGTDDTSSDDAGPDATADAGADVAGDVLRDTGDGGEDVRPEVVEDIVEDVPPSDVYGAPADIEVFDDVPSVDAAYGLPPDVDWGPPDAEPDTSETPDAEPDTSETPDAEPDSSETPDAG